MEPCNQTTLYGSVDNYITILMKNGQMQSIINGEGDVADMSCESKNKISIYRGDDKFIKVMFSETAYTPSLDDMIRLVIKKNVFDTDFVLQKNTSAFVVSIDELRFRIYASDTVNMEPGMYKFDIEITLPNGIVMTVVRGADIELIGDIATPEV